jgi:hypothetical protein
MLEPDQIVMTPEGRRVGVQCYGADVAPSLGTGSLMRQATGTLLRGCPTH